VRDRPVALVWALFLGATVYGHVALKLAMDGRGERTRDLLRGLASPWAITGLAAWCLSSPLWLRPLAKDTLFSAASTTLLDIAADPEHLGAKIGFLAILHTCSQTLLHHPHVHCIGPGGGISPAGTRLVQSPPDLFPPAEGGGNGGLHPVFGSRAGGGGGFGRFQATPRERVREHPRARAAAGRPRTRSGAKGPRHHHLRRRIAVARFCVCR